MQQLHFVGFTTDRDGLIFSARKGSKSGGYVINVDGVLLAQIDQLVRWRDGADQTDPSFSVPELPPPPPPPPSPKRPPRPESHLTPRAIQARLRAGHSLAEVAAEAGVGEDWVARFAAPILHERASVIDQAGRMTANKLRVGPSYQPLATAVRWNLVDRGCGLSDDGYDEAWSAFQRSDAAWVVRVSFVARNRIQHADWLVDLTGQRLSALNRQAAELGYVDAVRRPPEDGLPPGPATRPVIGVVSTPSQLSKSEAKPSQAGPIELADPLPEEFFDDDELPSRHRRDTGRRKPLPRSVPEPPPARHPVAPDASIPEDPEDQAPPGVTVLTPRPAEAPGLGRRRRPLVADQRPERRQPPRADELGATQETPTEQPAAAAGHGGATNGRATNGRATNGRATNGRATNGRANGRASRRAATTTTPGQTPWWSPGPERPKPASNGRRVRPAEAPPERPVSDPGRLSAVARGTPVAEPMSEAAHEAAANEASANEAPANGHAGSDGPARRRIRAAEQIPVASTEEEAVGAYVPRLLRLAGGNPSPARSQPPTTVTISSSPIIRARAVPTQRPGDADPAAPPAEAAEAAEAAERSGRSPDPAPTRADYRHTDYSHTDYSHTDYMRTDRNPPASSGQPGTPTPTMPPPIPSARVDGWTSAERMPTYRTERRPAERVVPEPLTWVDEELDQPASSDVTATHIKAATAAERAEAHTDEGEILDDEERPAGEKRRRFFRRRRS